MIDRQWIHEIRHNVVKANCHLAENKPKLLSFVVDTRYKRRKKRKEKLRETDLQIPDSMTAKQSRIARHYCVVLRIDAVASGSFPFLFVLIQTPER